jgi:hypothetical protein
MGSYKWDLWALAAIICEADMPRDAHLHVTDERLKYILSETVFKKRKEAMMDL